MAEDRLGIINSFYESTKETQSYASKRIDVVLISLSSGSIVMNFQYIKWIVEEAPFTDLSYNITSIMLFGLCILACIVGQFFTFYGGRRDSIYFGKLLELMRKQSAWTGTLKGPKQHNNNIINFIINVLNYGSFALFLAGFVLTYLSISNFIYP